MIAGYQSDKGKHGYCAMLGQHFPKSGAIVGLEVRRQGFSFYNPLILFSLVWNEHGTLNPMIQAGGGRTALCRLWTAGLQTPGELRTAV